MRLKHEEMNDSNYKEKAKQHGSLGLDSTLYLAYRDIHLLLQTHMKGLEKGSVINILDYGCGAGFSTELVYKTLTEEGYQVKLFGLDRSEANLSEARQRVPNGTFYHLSSEMNLKDLGTFDLIVCNFVLVENKTNEMQCILNNIHSLLNENGIAIITNCAKAAYKKSNKWYTLNNDFEENKPASIEGNKIKFAEDQEIKLQVFSSFGSSLSFTFFDFFHSGKAYLKAYEQSGLDLLCTHKPKGSETDNKEWKEEYNHSPYKIHVVQKSSNMNLSYEKQ